MSYRVSQYKPPNRIYSDSKVLPSTKVIQSKLIFQGHGTIPQMLHYNQYGQGHPLIILHGLLGSSNNWRTQANALSTYFDVYTLDLRNHGMSFHHHEMGYHDMADDVIQFINKYKLYNPILLGHSMGGKVALTIADQLSEQIQQLIIVDIVNKAYDSRHLTILHAMEQLSLGNYDSLQDLNYALKPDIPNQAMRQFILTNIVKNANQFKWKVNVPAIKKNYPKIAQKAPMQTTKINIPTLFIQGENSDYITSDDISQLHDNFDNVEVTTIPNTGHWPHLEAPTPFLNAIISFLEHDMV